VRKYRRNPKDGFQKFEIFKPELYIYSRAEEIIGTFSIYLEHQATIK
jgi:hypothetical protein